MDGAGGFDWLAIWREMYDRERAQAEARDQATPPADCWQGQAARVAAAWRQRTQPDGFMRFLQPFLQPDDTVLDIGAGTGRYTLYLADQVARVIAVEPSAAMRAQLEAALAEAGHASIEVIGRSWPDQTAIPLQPVDIAFAANVLYGVREVEPFLRAMNTVAARACFVVLAVDPPAAFISPFWERFYGEPRLPLPAALECLNVLYQLGLPAQLSLVPREGRIAFASRDEALHDLGWRLRLAPSPEHEAALLAAIDELLLIEADGRLVPPHQHTHTAVIWWQKVSQSSA